jgi:hypothetical protein
MPFLSYDKALELRRDLDGTAEVLTFGSEGYAESLRRWSDTCEKEAVSMSLFLNDIIAHSK